MLVHRMEASQHLAELIWANSDHQRKTDSRIVGVATANPVPELEHVGGIDPELLYLLGVRGNSNKVLRYCLLTTKRPNTPITGRACIGQRLKRRKGFGGDDKERLCRVKVAGDLHKFVPINVGDEPHSQITIAVVLQCFICHEWTEI